MSGKLKRFELNEHDIMDMEVNRITSKFGNLQDGLKYQDVMHARGTVAQSIRRLWKRNNPNNSSKKGDSNFGPAALIAVNDVYILLAAYMTNGAMMEEEEVNDIIEGLYDCSKIIASNPGILSEVMWTTLFGKIDQKSLKRLMKRIYVDKLIGAKNLTRLVKYAGSVSLLSVSAWNIYDAFKTMCRAMDHMANVPTLYPESQAFIAGAKLAKFQNYMRIPKDVSLLHDRAYDRAYTVASLIIKPINLLAWLSSFINQEYTQNISEYLGNLSSNLEIVSQNSTCAFVFQHLANFSWTVADYSNQVLDTSLAVYQENLPIVEELTGTSSMFKKGTNIVNEHYDIAKINLRTIMTNVYLFPLLFAILASIIGTWKCCCRESNVNKGLEIVHDIGDILRSRQEQLEEEISESMRSMKWGSKRISKRTSKKRSKVVKKSVRKPKKSTKK